MNSRAKTSLAVLIDMKPSWIRIIRSNAAIALKSGRAPLRPAVAQKWEGLSPECAIIPLQYTDSVLVYTVVQYSVPVLCHRYTPQ